MTVKSTEQFRELHDPTHETDKIEMVFHRILPKNIKYAIVVGAQNATPVVAEWWAILNRIAAHLGAEMFVIPLRYKNPTSIWTASQRNDEWWSPDVQPYLWSVRCELNKNLMLMADIKIPPTKSSPLSGFDAISTAHSAIFGHPKLQLRSIPTPSSRMAKIITTTGVVTQENYTDTGLGKISAFHHSLSAVLVELDGAKFHLRQLHYDKKTKSCIDLNMQYFEGRTIEAPRASTLMMGDMHIGFIDPKVDAARDRLIELVRPRHRIWHDTLDSYSCTPHHEGNPFIQQGKQAVGRDDVRAEIDAALEYIKYKWRRDVTDVFVPSNHDDMLSRWVKRADWKTLSARNADFYLETALAMRRGSIMTKSGVSYPDPFSYWLGKAGIKNAVILNRGSSFVRLEVDFGSHGDVGPNGARGSIKNMRRLGTKMSIGHTHSPGIDEGCTQGGTSTHLQLEYNHGASGWLNADVLQNATGKRQLIIYVDGSYRLEG